MAYFKAQLQQQAVRAAGSFVAVAWSQALGSLLAAAFDRDNQASRIAVSATVCLVFYASAAVFVHLGATRGQSDSVLVFVVSVGGAVAISFRDLTEEFVGLLDRTEARWHQPDAGHFVGAGEAELPGVLLVTVAGVLLVLVAARLRGPSSAACGPMQELEVDAFGFSVGWALCDALFRVAKRAVPEQARGWACCCFVLLALRLAERAVLSLGHALHRRPMLAGSTSLLLLEHLHGTAWAFVLALSVAYALNQLHVTDASLYGRFVTAALASLLAVGAAVQSAATQRACARFEFATLAELLRSLPHVRWPSALGAYVHRHSAVPPDPRQAGCSPRALRARAGAIGAWLRASVNLVTSADGSETSVYTLDPDFHRTLRVLRAQPAGAFVVFETAQLARAPATSAHWGGDPALALVRTSLAEGDVLVVPVVRLPTGRWTTAEMRGRSVRAQLAGVAVSLAVGWVWEQAFDHLFERLPGEARGHGHRWSVVGAKGALALLSAAAFTFACRKTHWHTAARHGHWRLHPPPRPRGAVGTSGVGYARMEEEEADGKVQCEGSELDLSVPVDETGELELTAGAA
ncbi:hypothetical protein T492DRAFT_907427, partial [Pavlovales sp. CCMP2436]